MKGQRDWRSRETHLVRLESVDNRISHRAILARDLDMESVDSLVERKGRDAVRVDKGAVGGRTGE